nr:avirulence effector protein AVR-Mgk1 [Pyricularia oryzae]
MWSKSTIVTSAALLLFNQAALVAARNCRIWQDMGSVWQEVVVVTPPVTVDIITKRHGAFSLFVPVGCGIRDTGGALRATETDDPW